MYSVYLLKSNDTNWYYVGMTSDINTRIKKHNNKGVNSTKPYAPLELIYTREFEHRTDARDYEKFLKIRCNKEKLISSLKDNIQINSADVAKW